MYYQFHKKVGHMGPTFCGTDSMLLIVTYTRDICVRIACYLSKIRYYVTVCKYIKNAVNDRKIIF